jgi:hypothetical protein
MSTYRALCVQAGVKPQSTLLKLLGDEVRDMVAVRSVDLSRTFVGARHITLLAKVIVGGGLASLEELDLSGNDVPSEAIQLLLDAATSEPASKVPLLRRLALRLVYVSPEDAQRLVDLVRASPQLLFVDVEGGDVPADAVTSLAVETELHRQRVRAVTDEMKPSHSTSNASQSLVQIVTSPVSTTSLAQQPHGAPLASLPDVQAARASRLIAEMAPTGIVDDYEWLTNDEDLEDEDARLQELLDQGVGMQPAEDVVEVPLISVSAPTRQAVAADVSTLNSIPRFATVNDVVQNLVRRGRGARGYEADDSNERFIDPEFLPCAASLVSSSGPPPTSTDAAAVAALAAAPTKFTIRGRRVCWRRLTDRADCTLPKMFNTVPSPIVKGRATANQWLTSSLRVLRVMNQSSAALQLLCAKAYVELGVFAIRLRKADQEVEVVVDDYVPVDAESGELLCIHNSDPNELWAALVEKAMAKLHGGYDRLACGSLRSGVLDLLGGQCTKQRWHLADVKNMVASGALAKLVHDRVHAQTLDSVVLAQPKAKGELQRNALAASGLSPNDGYIVDAVRQLDDRTNVLRLRQPVPTYRWKGRFGPESRELTDPSTRTTLGWRPEQSDRHFWMTIEDFAAFFGTLYTLEWFAASEDRQRALVADHFVQWLQGEHCGPIDRDPLWTGNPTVGLRVKHKNTAVSISVTQPCQRLKATQPLSYAAAMQVVVVGRALGPSGTVVTVPSSTTASIHDPSGSPTHLATPDPHKLRRDWRIPAEVLFKSPLIATRDVAVDLVLQPNVDYYVVVSFANAKAAKARVRIQSLGRVVSTDVESPEALHTARGEWAMHSAGGAAYSTVLARLGAPPLLIEPHPRGATNPQYLLKVKRRCDVTIVLAQEAGGGNAPLKSSGSRASRACTVGGTNVDEADLVPIGFVVCESASAINDVDTIAKKRVASTEMAKLRSVSLELALDNTTYLIVPCTQLPGQELPFSLNVYSTEPLEVKKANL